MILAVSLLMIAPLSAQQPDTRHELSASYGTMPISDWASVFGGMFSVMLTGQATSLSTWGGVAVGYNYRVTRTLGVGARLGYSSNVTTGKSTGQEITNAYWSLMPEVKWNWVNGKVVSLYSRAGAGVVLNAATSYDNQHDSSLLFAWQVYPLGIEVGKSVAGFLEGGLGMAGTIVAGVSYRF